LSDEPKRIRLRRNRSSRSASLSVIAGIGLTVWLKAFLGDAALTGQG